MTSDQYRIYNQLIKQGDKLQAKLFKLTLEFTLDDWRAIRTPEYWVTLDGIPMDKPYDRLLFQFQQVGAYVSQKNSNS